MSRGHKSAEKYSSFHIIAGIWVVIAAVIALAFFFAPDAPEIPEPSEMSYAKRPDDRVHSRFNGGEASVFNGHFTDDGDIVETERERGEERIPDKYHIYGVVTDGKTGHPLKNVHVACQRQWTPEEKEQWFAERDAALAASGGSERLRSAARDYDARRGIVTNDKGQYALRLPMLGKYHLQVFRDGYLTVKGKEAVLDEANEKLRVDIVLSPGASISGRVMETGSKKGIPGIEVYSSTAGHVTATTDRDGNYTLGGLVPGNVEISLSLKDQPYRASSKIPIRNVTIQSPEEEVKGVDFALEPAGVVWGYVLDRDRAPIEGVEVLICSSASLLSQAVDAVVKQAPPITCRSDEEGYYELVGVPLNKEWRVFGLSDKMAPQLSNPFLLTDAQRDVRIDLFMLPGSNVYGQVVTPEGTGIPSAHVVCIPGYSKLLQPFDTAHAFREMRSDQTGMFMIPNLPIGEYQILANKDGYKISVMGEPVYSDGMSEIRNVQVTLAAIDSGNFTVFGVVTDAAGRPLDRVSLTLAGVGTESMSAADMSTRTDSSGEFGFYGVEPGFLILTAEREGYSQKIVKNVQLDEPTNIVLDAAAVVRGRVLVRETGRAPGGSYSITATPLGGASGGGGIMGLISNIDNLGSRSFSATDGSFELSLAAGEYKLDARSSGLTPGSTHITVESGKALEDVVIYVSETGGTIQGRVIMGDGSDPSGALVWIGDSSTATSGSLLDSLSQTQRKGIQVGQDGSFEFDKLAEGSYTVFAKAEGYAQGSRGPIEVKHGRTVKGADITVGSGGTLQGYVAQKGEYLPGAVISVTGAGVTEMTTADQNGQYVITGLPAGVYRAVAVAMDGLSLNNFSPMQAQVVIEEGQTTVHNFGGEAGAIIAGLCSPPPTGGKFGLVLVTVPGALANLGQMNPMDLAALFTEGGMGSTIVGLNKVGPDGYFEITGVPEGDFDLYVIYASMAEMMAGLPNPNYSQQITVQGQNPVELRIEVPGQ